MCPGLDRLQQHPSDAGAPVFVTYKDTFQECNGRRLASIDVIMAQSRLREGTDANAIDCIQKDDAFIRSFGEHHSSFIPVLIERSVGPELRAEFNPALDIRIGSNPYWHISIVSDFPNVRNVPGAQAIKVDGKACFIRIVGH